MSTPIENNTAALRTLLEKANALPDAGPGGGSSSGGGGKSYCTFYDFDGTVVTSWTKEELNAAAALPDNPSHDGLTAQGWNWSLADLKALGRECSAGQKYITDDGKTRVYIRLEEGRTSPMLGCCPNGTVTVDWGDGTTPDTLTGTSTTTVKWTPTHNYAAPGDYVITLTVDGEMGFYGSTPSNQYAGILRYSSGGDTRNYVYRNSVLKIEIGDGVTSIGASAFYNCGSLSSITIPDGVTSLGSYAFQECYSLASIAIPDGVTSIGINAFYKCYSLASIAIPDGVTSIGTNAFRECYSLASITIPDGVTSIGTNAFYNCYSLAKLKLLPETPPTVANANAFTGIPTDCVVEVPAASLEAYQNATNYGGIAAQMIGV